MKKNVILVKIENNGLIIMNDWGALESRLQHQIDIHNAIENRDYKISLSVGIAYSDLENRCSIDELMSRADTLMYEQKRSKRQ